ncbi:MAG: transcription termination factor NusA [Nitrospinota bacterium]
MNQELLYILNQIERERAVPREVLLEAVRAAIVSASKRHYGLGDNVEAEVDGETGDLTLYCKKTAVSQVEDPELQISLEEARQLNPDATEGQEVRLPLALDDLGRIAAQTAKQVILQRVREAERANIYNEFKDRVGELVMGVVSQVERGNIYVDVGRAEALLPRREQIFREVYKRADRIRAYILEVREVSRGPQIILSRTHPGLLMKLFAMEVPEIYEGIVEIKACVREPSGRAKVAVVSHDSDVDPVGACVGTRGSRVQAVVLELHGEKVDIISWSSDLNTYAANALSPARVQHIVLHEEEQRMEVIVADDQLSLAIGKQGQNVRLAAKLLGWRIDLVGEGEYRKRVAATTFAATFAPRPDIEELSVVGEKMASLLSAHGFSFVEKVVGATIEELTAVPGIGPKRAAILKEAAAAHLAAKAARAGVAAAEEGAEVEAPAAASSGPPLDGPEAAGEGAATAGEGEGDEPSQG